MRMSRLFRSLFGAAVVTAVLLASCASSKVPPTIEQQAETDLQEYQAQIRKLVPDAERADKLVGYASEFQKLLVARITSARAHAEKVAELDSRHSAALVEYEVLLGEDDQSRAQFLEQVVALRTEAAAVATDEEWDQLKKVRMRKLEAMLEGVR